MSQVQKGCQPLALGLAITLDIDPGICPADHSGIPSETRCLTTNPNRTMNYVGML